MLESSRNLKISVFVNFSDTETESIDEVAILLLKGKQVIRGRILGKNIDESDDELLEKIFTEETSSDMFDSQTLKLGLRTLDTSFNDVIIQEIFGFMETLKSVIMRIDDSDADEDKYVVYNDNKEEVSQFFNEFNDYVGENDETLFPTSMKTIFNKDNDIKTIFASYGYTDLMYVESSSISNAAFNAVAFDLSLGYR